MVNLREVVRQALPPKVVHAYRVIRHTMLWPHEWEMVAARQFLSPHKVAVDVGANVGLFASVLARHSRKVIAFEANPECAAHLAKVMPRNCEIVAKAVSDHAGRTTLRVPVSDGTISHALGRLERANRLDAGPEAANCVTYTVETVTLDRVLLAQEPSSDRIGFVNIDAEGHEFAILRGGEGMLAAHRPVLLLELEYRHGSQVAEIFEWLERRRYVPRALIDTRNLTSIDAEGLRPLQDDERLARRLAGDRHAGYVNNVFFLPEA